MTTPILDFVRSYVSSDTSRLHMPGHKGKGPLGFETLDITEISGADELYAPEGIVLESERNAAALFGTGHTLYSTEGSSHCIRAMLFLALSHAKHTGSRPICLAGRNAHKSFLTAAALCDFDVEWLYPEAQSSSVCACSITPEGLTRCLDALGETPFCIYLTSPDYLGGMLDIASLGEVAHARSIPLLVDNAHGAYLRFLPENLHPIALGADMCCDSAHKTLPVLTGGAYLHIKDENPEPARAARRALALFGSTSPSYLVLQSLDAVNALLASELPSQFVACCKQLHALSKLLSERGFEVLRGEPMKLSLHTDGQRAAAALRAVGAEVEYADDAHICMMLAPGNASKDYQRIADALKHPFPIPEGSCMPFTRPPRAMSIHEASFARCETVPLPLALNRICAQPTVSCPPAVPVIVSGERVTQDALDALQKNHVRELTVVVE